MELHHLMSRKGYSRDLLYRDAANPQRYVNLRYWKSSAARAEAHEDPDVHKFWAGLGNVMRMQSVIETLERVEEDAKEMQ
jgi:quinol monooxygenase YgiN